MSRSRYFALCVLALAGTFAGGYAANLAIPVAHAQVIPPAQNIRATGFTLVNPQGKVEATLRSGAMGAELVLNDAGGNPRVEVGTAAGEHRRARCRGAYRMVFAPRVHRSGERMMIA